MNLPSDPRTRRYLIIAGLFIILSVSLLFWASDVIREVIVLPLSYLIYVFGIILDYTPQIFFWIVLLLIGARIAYLSISRKKKKVDDEYAAYYRSSEDAYVNSGRILFWANKVYQFRTGRGTYFTRTFHEALSHSLLQLLAYRYRLTPLQVEERIKDDSLDLPQDIRAYALKNLEVDDANEAGGWDAIREWVSTTWRKLLIRLKINLSFERDSGNAAITEAVDPGDNKADLRLATNDALVRRVLIFMKEELEVPHDDSGL